jgi:uncharacterized protein YigA (DUF484 family)
MSQDSTVIAAYLRDHPEFFAQHPELLARMQIPDPNSGRAISLTERQMLALREQNRLLEGKLRELIQFGEENDNISERVHRITLALMMAHDLSGLLRSLYHNLRDDFSVPSVALRLWPDRVTDPQENGGLAETELVSDEVRVFAESLTNPYCGGQAMFESGDWFGPESPSLRSYAYVALRAESAFGLLVLGSDDAGRFFAGMGTLYLKRLGELISMALRRYH